MNQYVAFMRAINVAGHVTINVIFTLVVEFAGRPVTS
jgi:hypothetical protein